MALSLELRGLWFCYPTVKILEPFKKWIIFGIKVYGKTHSFAPASVGLKLLDYIVIVALVVVTLILFGVL